MPNNPDRFDLVVVGTGIASLQATFQLLRTKLSLLVPIFERCLLSGSRTHNVRQAEGLEMSMLGAWRADGSVKMTPEPLLSHNVELREWGSGLKAMVSVLDL